MVRVIGKDADGTEQLLGDDHPHQRMRQGHRPQRPGLIGRVSHALCEAIGSTDQKRQIAALHAPLLQSFAECFTAVRLATAIKQDHTCPFGNGGQQTLRLIVDGALRVARFAALARREFDQLQGKTMCESLGVFDDQ